MFSESMRTSLTSNIIGRQLKTVLVGSYATLDLWKVWIYALSLSLFFSVALPLYVCIQLGISMSKRRPYYIISVLFYFPFASKAE